VSEREPSLGTAELRAAVRSVLREVLRDRLPEGLADGLPEGLADRGAAAPVRDVVLRSDADLTAFVREVAELAEDPQRRAALRAGRHGFRLAATPATPTTPAASVAAAVASRVLRVERGAVTERMVRRAADAGHRLVVGPHAVLTPLARDRARSLGIAVEKEHAEKED
jgi:hypothetical protein